MLDLRSMRVTVMGLGRFGGGLGVSRWLAEQGARVLLTDRATPDELAEPLAALRDLVDAGSIALRLGEHREADFRSADLVVANPAVPLPWADTFLHAAASAGVPVTTEIALMLERLPVPPSRTIAVTGTVGKSTTTAMIHHALSSVLSAEGAHVALGGNIGGSLLPHLPPAGPLSGRSYVVLELSSFMLHWIGAQGLDWSPGVGVVTNIGANHTDWHGSFEHYAASKQRLISRQRSCDTAILGESVSHWRSLTPARTLAINPADFPRALSVPGAHNRSNAAAALAACAAAAPDFDPALFTDAISAFPGLEHRLQLVARLPLRGPEHPVSFFNDSKSTTPEATLTAVEAIAADPLASHDRIHLIAGGYDKKSDLSPVSALAARLAGLYTIGATGPSIARSAPLGAAVIECGTLASALASAASRARPGDSVLLSPACASWDQYANFEARGTEFIALVRSLASSIA